MKNWMIYGANGYTGELIARYAKTLGHHPILAGRNAQSVGALAHELSLPAQSFDLSDEAAVLENLAEIGAVLNCAGPFSKTTRPLVEACLKQSIHYLDITGEIDALEWTYEQHERAVSANCTMIPAVGFDVVPTDCLAASLQLRLPTADHLSLAIGGGNQVSKGTLKTMIENIPEKSRVRSGGHLKHVAFLSRCRSIPFPRGEAFACAIPWGDLSSAYRSTQIPNIVVYAVTPPVMTSLKKVSPLISKFFSIPFVQATAQAGVELFVTGPKESERSSRSVWLWGEVSNPSGETVSGLIKVPDGYSLTVQTALKSVLNVMEGKTAPGAWTPTQAFGASYIFEFEGVESRLPEMPDSL